MGMKNGWLKYLLSTIGFIFIIYILQSKYFSLTEADRSILGNFIEWYGILLSVLLALLVVQVWTKFTMINLLIDQEADALASLLRFARFRKAPGFFNKLLNEVIIYCKNNSSSNSTNSKSNKQYREQQEKIFEILLGAIEPDEKSCVSNEMIRVFDLSVDIRGDREALLKERIHNSLWFLLIISSAIWILCFIWLSFQNIRWPLGAFMVFFSTFTIGSLLFIAKDIDSPTGGVWKVSYASFNETVEEISSFKIIKNQKKGRKLKKVV